MSFIKGKGEGKIQQGLKKKDCNKIIGLWYLKQY